MSLLNLPEATPGLNGLLLRRAPALDSDLRYLRQRNTFFWQLSPSRVVTTRFFNKLENDKFFPNELAKTSRSLTLPDGKKMLFRDYEYELPDQDRGPAAVAQTMGGLLWLKSELDKRHIRLIVLLVPTRCRSTPHCWVATMAPGLTILTTWTRVAQVRHREREWS